MENENVYEAPKSEVMTPDYATRGLASRWARLGASLLDTIIMMIFLVPLLFWIGFYDQLLQGVEPSLMENLLIGGFSIVVFFAINLHFLLKSGQTLGKKIVGIRIVNLDGEKLDLMKNILPRYAVYFLPGQVPIVGSIFSIVNILFIFGKEKRCIHDFAAKTKVVEN